MTQHDVVGIGNAIVDVLAEGDDSFLDLMGIQKGVMQLVERERAELLYAAMRGPRQAPGGRWPTRWRAWATSASAQPSSAA